MGAGGNPAEGVLARVLTAVQALGVEEIEGAVERQVRDLGLRDVRFHVVDHGQASLRSLGHDDEAPVDGSVVGRSYVTGRQLVVERDRAQLVLTPLLLDTDRIGVMSVITDHADDEHLAVCGQVADLVAALVVVRGLHSDRFIRRKRAKPVSLATEMQWQQLPPLGHRVPEMTIAAILEPSHAIAGDAFDYAWDGRIAHVAIFDAMGHGLHACRLSTITLAAYRHARRKGLGLAQMYTDIDGIVAETFGPESFVTGVLAELDLDTGGMRWLNAGHPPPLLLRGRRVVGELEQEPVVPFGMGGDPAIRTASLEPGDRVLLVTDGALEARSPDGAFFGLDRIVEAVSRQAAGERTMAEQLRQLVLELGRFTGGSMQDDATAVLVEWTGIEGAGSEGAEGKGAG